MTQTILLLAGAYALVIVFLVLILISSRLPAVLKALATLATAGLLLWTYQAIGELRGLPTDGAPPRFFKLHWARVVEPNLLMKEEGHVFLWIEELDELNFPSGLPRAYALPYDPELVKKVEIAMGKIQDGEEVAGTISDEAAREIEGTAEELAEEVAEGARATGPSSGEVGERYFDFDPSMLDFGDAPAPVTPEKDK